MPQVQDRRNHLNLSYWIQIKTGQRIVENLYNYFPNLNKESILDKFGGNLLEAHDRKPKIIRR